MCSDVNKVASAFNITVITLYPEMFDSFASEGMFARAIDQGLWQLDIINLRDFGIGKHHSVDDTVYGGGCGLLLRADVLGNAIDYAMIDRPHNQLVYVTPKGKVYNQQIAQQFSQLSGITFICGRFEGIDQRILEYYQPLECSVGDYIVSGGELPVMLITDSILRLLPNMVNSYYSVIDESFNDNLLECPHYTKPRMWQGLGIPEVLLTGNHQAIESWRKEHAINLTKKRRPDLLTLNNSNK